MKESFGVETNPRLMKTPPVCPPSHRSSSSNVSSFKIVLAARLTARVACVFFSLWYIAVNIFLNVCFDRVDASPRFLAAKRLADQAEAKAARQAAKRKREAAALQREKEAAAARSMQALARGVATRQAVSEALESRGLPLLLVEQRRRVRTSLLLRLERDKGVVGDMDRAPRAGSCRPVCC